MFYSGSVSPPREPAKKKYIIPKRRQPEKKMGDDDASSSAGKTAVPVGSLMWPMLDRSNYSEWAMLIQCNLEAMEVWDVVEQGGKGVKRACDRLAMSALLHSVPKEMWTTLGAKKTVKEAWDAVKSMRQGADRVKKSHGQKLLQEFENIQFKNGELIDEFGLRINSLAEKLRGLGEVVGETRVVKKILRVLPKQYNQIAVSIETLLNINTLTVEELVGRLRAAEDCLDVDTVAEKTEKLYLSED
jgi:hypothetical protein